MHGGHCAHVQRDWLEKDSHGHHDSLFLASCIPRLQYLYVINSNPNICALPRFLQPIQHLPPFLHHMCSSAFTLFLTPQLKGIETLSPQRPFMNFLLHHLFVSLCACPTQPECPLISEQGRGPAPHQQMQTLLLLVFFLGGALSNFHFLF